MNEPPGARARVGLSGLTVAEHFRDQGQDVLFFVDNIFRFTQAGSEVSALLGRIPSAVGYQPTLATDMGALQERITTTTKGSVTSVQAIYVPADDLTDPAPATSFAHLDATTVLSRDIAAKGIYPAVDPLELDLAHALAADRRRGALRGRASGAAGAPALQGAAGHHRHSGHGRAVGRGQARRSRARARSSASCRSRSSSPKCSPARPASSSISPTPSRASRAWSKASTITCRKPPSTWSAHRRGRMRRARSSRPKRRKAKAKMSGLVSKIAGHPDYQEHARAASVISIVIASGVPLFIAFFKPWGFGLAWLIVIPILWFAVSILLAFPRTLAKFWIATSMPVAPTAARGWGGIFDTLCLPFEAIVVYYVLRGTYMALWG